jgi:hypothetical protein
MSKHSFNVRPRVLHVALGHRMMVPVLECAYTRSRRTCTPLNPGLAATATGSVAPARPGPLVVAHRRRALIAVSLTTELGAMLARLIGSAARLSPWTIYVLTPFRLDGLTMGAFLAALAGQPEGVERLVRALPRRGPGASFVAARASSFLERRTLEQGAALFTTSAVFNDSSGRLNDSSAHRN